MTDWDALITELEQRWDKSQAEVSEQLVVTTRYAILTPLNSIRAASSLLEDYAKSPQVRKWAKKCHQMCQEWLNDYTKLQEYCVSSSDNAEMACKCIIQGIGLQLASSEDFLAQSMHILELAEGEMAGVVKMLFHNLSTIATIHKEIQAQNLSWVLTYIDEEDKLSRE